MIKLTESEKLENKLRRMFEREFVNYNLQFAQLNKRQHGTVQYVVTQTELMFLAYQAGYHKGKK